VARVVWRDPPRLTGPRGPLPPSLTGPRGPRHVPTLRD